MLNGRYVTETPPSLLTNLSFFGGIQAVTVTVIVLRWRGWHHSNVRNMVITAAIHIDASLSVFPFVCLSVSLVMIVIVVVM